MLNPVQKAQERAKLIGDWARYAAERLQRSITKRRIGSSGDLSYSILYRLSAIANGDISSAAHEFNYYGKFVDMGVGRGQKIENVKSNAEIIRVVGGGRRPKKWFSKTYYAEVAELRNLLLVKYGETAAQNIKETIQ